jgi:putative glutamine amidotransferase
VVQDKYLAAVVAGARCMPLVLPALPALSHAGNEAALQALLDTADGIMLTGSASNVHSELYGEPLLDPTLPLDAARDATTLPLVRVALKRGIPLLAICRGFQELNVALGGSLHQAVHALPGMQDHRDRDEDSLEEQYGPAHRVAVLAGGRLARILDGVDGNAGAPSHIMVNSLHGQGVRQLAEGLLVEAVADDGLVEACSVEQAPGFALAVQWHPEWRVADNPVTMKLFSAFGDACRAYQAAREP